MVLAQMDAATLDVLERIATSQFIMAFAMAILLIPALGAAAIFMMEFGKLRRLMADMSVLMAELKRVAVPLIEGATVIVTDTASITAEVRVRLNGLLDTLEGVDLAIQKGAIATEDRVRRFGEVLDVVQTEAEDLLLDAAATARGVHETARVLREPRPHPAVRRNSETHIDSDDEREVQDDGA
ncbi:MAG TPA: hypothetical protein VMN60_01355 [Longimicrobiales bacterium]|nr:hypothetical protein [Longimicrobiales bacterium]